MVIGLPCLVLWTVRFPHFWLRDHGSCPPWADTTSCSSQKHSRFVSVIASLGLQSWFWHISLSLSPGREIMAVSESNGIGFSTPIQVNEPYGSFILFSKSDEGCICTPSPVRNGRGQNERPDLKETWNLIQVVLNVTFRHEKVSLRYFVGYMVFFDSEMVKKGQNC